MTILKKLILGLAITPLAISITFAAGGNEPLKGQNTINKPTATQSNLQQPAIAKERRVIQQRDVKSLSDETTKLEHYENTSECYRLYPNRPTTVNIKGRKFRISCLSIGKNEDVDFDLTLKPERSNDLEYESHKE